MSNIHQCTTVRIISLAVREKFGENYVEEKFWADETDLTVKRINNWKERK